MLSTVKGVSMHQICLYASICVSVSVLCATLDPLEEPVREIFNYERFREATLIHLFLTSFPQ